MLLAVPFLTLIALTRWRHFHLAWGDGNAIAISTGLGVISLLLIVTTALAIWLASAIYERSILRTGKALKWREALRG